MGSKIRIAIVGGAGFWANDGHLRNIHKAVVEEPNIDAKVIALVDPINPRLQSGERKEHLERILLTDDRYNFDGALEEYVVVDKQIGRAHV